MTVMKEKLVAGNVYSWESISLAYPNKYAIITDVERDKGVILKCKLLEVVPYSKKTETVLRYMDSGISFDCVRTTYSAPNVGVLC